MEETRTDLQDKETRGKLRTVWGTVETIDKRKMKKMKLNKGENEKNEREINLVGEK